MIYVELLIIAMVVCYVVDITGVVDSIKRLIWKWLKGSEYKDFLFKPFDCSLCMVFWVCLIYSFFNGIDIWVFGYICLLSMMSEVITKLLTLARVALNKIEDKILSWVE